MNEGMVWGLVTQITLSNIALIKVLTSFEEPSAGEFH